MLCWTWGTWPDVLIDFGAQLYIPWQLAQGKVLYTEVAHYNGPLSQYVNAAVFRLFGASLRTLVLFNLVLLAGLTALLHHALQQVADRWSAAAACLVFMLLFAFAQYLEIGSNYNYVCPYAHEMTHGLVLSLVALVSVWQYPRWGLTALAGGGLALGLAFLTKAEVFLGGVAGVSTAVGLAAWQHGSSWRRRLVMTATVAAAAVLPPVLAVVALGQAMPPSRALVGTLGSWIVLFKPQVTSLRFFREGMGIANPWQSLGLLLLGGAAYAGVLTLPCVLALGARDYLRWRLALTAATFGATALAAMVLGPYIAWFEAVRPLPLILLLCGAVLAVRFVRRRCDVAGAQRLLRQVSLVVFALVLLGKVVLNAHIYHYGFVLAMPATMVLVVVLLGWAPAAINRAGGAGEVFAGAALALLGAAVVAHLADQSRWIALKTYRVGTGADAFWTDRRAEPVNACLGEIKRLSSSGETMTALPEGAMLNYLAKRPSAVAYVNFMPTEMHLFGEQQMLSDLQTHPPDLIVVVHKDTSEFGARFFGQHYGRAIGAWVQDNYRPITLIGAPPLSGPGFGIAVLRRKDSPVPVPHE
jgi:hypothetical protein